MRTKLLQTCGLTAVLGLWGCGGSDSVPDGGRESVAARLLRESMVVVEALNGSGTVDFASLTVKID